MYKIILINTPFITSPAGVSNHYLGLRPYFSKRVIYNQYITMNYIKRKVKSEYSHEPLRLISFVFDVLKFILLIFYYRYPLVLLNPSFSSNAIKRDALFLKITKYLGCKGVVFIHGWDKGYLKSIMDKNIKFDDVWYKADGYFVLANEFKKYLEDMGIKAPIYTTTTKVDDRMVDNFSINSEKNSVDNILFLARVEKNKGIFIAIDTFVILLKKYPHLKLRIVGRGSSLEEAKEYVKKHDISNIVFTGPLYGKELINEYKNADIYILPTTHGEGMPTSVLEAMAFGLPVITRPVGGLRDFFEDEKMGYLIESLNPNDYAKIISHLIEHPEKCKSISKYNNEYAKKNFMASKVAAQLEKVLGSI